MRRRRSTSGSDSAAGRFLIWRRGVVLCAWVLVPIYLSR